MFYSKWNRTEVLMSQGWIWFRDFSKPFFAWLPAKMLNFKLSFWNSVFKRKPWCFHLVKMIFLILTHRWCFPLFHSVTLDHYRRDSPTHLMLITAFLKFWPKVHREPHIEVELLSPVQQLVGFKPGSSWF